MVIFMKVGLLLEGGAMRCMYSEGVIDVFLENNIKIDNLKDRNSLEILGASGSIPFVSKPVAVNNKKYLDGGIADSIPIDKIMSMGFDKVIVVLTRPNDYKKKRTNQTFPKIYFRKYPNFAKAVNNRYKKYNEELEKVSKLEKEGKIIVIRPSKLVKVKRIEKDANKLQEMYDLGKDDTLKLLDKIKE